MTEADLERPPSLEETARGNAYPVGMRMSNQEAHSVKPTGADTPAALLGDRSMQQSELDDYQSSGEDLWKDEDLLIELYVRERLPASEIADRLGCTQNNIYYWLKKYDIERRDGYQPTVPDELQDPEWLHAEYVEKNRTATAIADDLGCSGPAVGDWLDRHGIERKTQSEAHKASARRKPAWHRINSQGYEECGTRSGGDRQEIAIHRLVAVAEYGFDEVCGKVIHHKNRIPWDNRPENIEVLTSEEHGRLHAEERYDRDGYYIHPDDRGDGHGG